MRTPHMDAAIIKHNITAFVFLSLKAGAQCAPYKLIWHALGSGGGRDSEIAPTKGFSMGFRLSRPTSCYGMSLAAGDIATWRSLLQGCRFTENLSVIRRLLIVCDEVLGFTHVTLFADGMTHWKVTFLYAISGEFAFYPTYELIWQSSVGERDRDQEVAPTGVSVHRESICDSTIVDCV